VGVVQHKNSPIRFIANVKLRVTAKVSRINNPPFFPFEREGCATSVPKKID
jgi:hypothetical protein